jgi:amino acid transporter
MAIAVLLVFLSAFVPILIGTGASKAPYSEWRDGYFVQLGKEIVGPWLSYWLMLGSGLTNIGMFEAEMSSDSWQIAGMADRGILPSFLGDRSSYDTPTIGILLSASGVLCLCWMSFSDIIDMLNLLFCFGQAIEFFAFVYLRLYKPDMPRPYRIPLNNTGIILMTIFPLLFIGVIIYFSSLASLIVSSSLTVFGFILYYLLEAARKNEWCMFHDRCSDDQNVELPAFTTPVKNNSNNSNNT